MATSGSTNWTITRNQLINSAFRLIGIGLDGNANSSQMVNDAAQVLNMMIKAWQADGLHLWAQKKATLFLEADEEEYALGPTGDHCTSSYTKTAVKVAGATSDTSLDVDSTTGMAAGDYIGVVLDDDTLHWTTVSSVTDSDTVVLTTGLASAAAVDNVVYFYTSKIHRPLAITQAVRRDSNSNDIPLMKISRDEYWTLPNKTTAGTPNQIYFDPQLTDCKLYLYPPPSGVGDTIELVYHRPFEDFDALTDEPDFPQWWVLPIRYGLAMHLGHEYGIPEKIMMRITADAERFKDKALAFDQEDTSIFIRPTRYG